MYIKKKHVRTLETGRKTRLCLAFLAGFEVIPSTILIQFDSYHYEREQVNELFSIFYKKINNSEFQEIKNIVN